jgi:ribosomal protein S18 acetylase RimI-like enzyme
MMNAAEKWNRKAGMLHLTARGLAYAELEMDSANKPAMALYESLGYRVY